MSQLEQKSPAIVFDFGGVLLDWNPHYLYLKLFDDNHEEVERFLKEIGFAEWNLLQDRGRPFAVAVAELAERFPHHAELIRAYDERWEESVSGCIQPTVDILYALKQSGYALYGLSNWSAETFERIRHKHPFLDWFEEIVISGEVELIKPDPRIYAVLLDRIGRRAEECLFIDDAEANINVAARLGFKTILFESPRQLANELHRLGLLKGNGEGD
ncbi:MAG TPA: HAD family phosphatase [Pyrinomonadaceae bacterium]|jgi:2-haloacid dehalogenase